MKLYKANKSEIWHKSLIFVVMVTFLLSNFSPEIICFENLKAQGEESEIYHLRPMAEKIKLSKNPFGTDEVLSAWETKSSSAGAYIQDIIQRYEAGFGERLSEYEVLDAIAGMFGIREGDKKTRNEIAKRIAIAIYTSGEKESHLSKTVPFLKTYTATPTGEHRFMPLALAVANILRGKDIFDISLAGQMTTKDPRFSYLTKEHPLYANPMEVEGLYLPAFMPSLRLIVPDKRTYRWLDIGSAPKTKGAPCLEVVKIGFDITGKKCEVFGTDTAFPIYDGDRFMQDNSIVLSSEYNFDSSGRCVIKDITYLNADPKRFPQNNAMNDDFLREEKFDFISLCRVLHHLKTPNDTLQQLPLARGVDFIDAENRPVEVNYWFFPFQQEVIQRLLKKLNISGVLFMEFTPGEASESLNLANRRKNWHKTAGNQDLFIIIQRVDEKKFKIYYQAIPFKPDRRVFTSREFLLIGRRDGLWKSNGLSNIFPGYDEEIGRLLDRADILAYRFQNRDHNIWVRMMDAVDAMENPNATLLDIFSAYLADVPWQYKKALLTEVASLSSRLQRVTLLSPHTTVYQRRRIETQILIGA